MASDTQLRPRHTHRLTTWPPHGTGESILGTDLHQKTIIPVVDELQGKQ